MTKTAQTARTGMAALGMFLATSLMALSAAAEPLTVNAFAPYEGEGKLYLTGEKSATFVGAIKGQLYIESDKGPFPAGTIVCPGMLQINLENGQQAGSGQCTITGPDGGMAFGAWSCRGVHLIGCDGRLLLTGGSGKATGISGGGPITVRTTQRGLVKLASEPESLTSLGNGMLLLRGLKFEVPTK